MAFQQLYYTSCEHGPGGYSGFQFNAMTPGVTAAILREVEERTVYAPPRWLATENPDEPEAYPVAFSYGIDEPTGAAITANVVFTGTDYSGRPGNYFVHALVTSTPEQDFGSLLPAELWGAALWQAAAGSGTELHALTGPPSPGVIDRPRVQAFLDARQGDAVLPDLLTAVGRAMAGERPVLLVTQDATENAWWIASVSYLLGERLARQMTFTTYSHRPGYSRYHVTGALPGALLPETNASFQVFDFTDGRKPHDAIHPLATTLVSTGVMASSGLWQQAAAFASGAEATLDDWLAPVAVASGLLGGRLSADQADAVARWLPGAASRMPSGIADVGLGVVLAQPDETLTDERLFDLLNLARRLPAPPRVEHVERLLATRAIAHIARGEPATPVPLTSPVTQVACTLAGQALHTATPPQTVALVNWSAASGIELAESTLERYGRTRLGSDTPERELAGVVRCHPAIRRGFLERLADEPPEVTRALLSGPVGTQLRREDLVAHPELTELWLLESAARGRTPPLRAFDEIVDNRTAMRLSPRFDSTLLHLLWPHGCPPDDLAELLGILTDPAEHGATDWFARQIETVSARGTTSDQWLRLASVLADHQVLGMLPEQQTDQVRNAVRVLPLLQRARADGPRGDLGAFGRLFQEYTAADRLTRRMLERELPALLAAARPLGPALHGCPDDLAAAFCLALHDWLAPARADTALARRLFRACGHPAVLAQPGLTERLMTAFEQVRRWSRHDLNALAQSMGNDVELAQSFQRWRKAGRGTWPRRLLGGPGPSAQGT